MQDKDFLEKQIRELINAPGFVLSEKDYAVFLQVVSNMTFKTGTFEMALAFAVIALMDKDELIIKRNNREKDFTVLINVIIDMYQHVFDDKTTLLLLEEAIDKYFDKSDIDFRSSIIKGETNFNEVISFIRNPFSSQLTKQKQFIQKQICGLVTELYYRG